MAYPAKVIGFLDVAGAWDPSLLLVLGGAVGVTVISFRFVRRVARPALEPSFEAPPATRIDGALFVGAGLFGIGWGLSGFCPGPGITALGRLSPDAFVFVAAFVLGSFLYRSVRCSRARVPLTQDYGIDLLGQTTKFAESVNRDGKSKTTRSVHEVGRPLLYAAAFAELVPEIVIAKIGEPPIRTRPVLARVNRRFNRFERST